MNSQDNNLMDVKAVHFALGGCIGFKAIYKLMNSDVLPSVKIGTKAKLVTRRKDVDRFIDAMFTRPIDNGIIETIPVKNILDFKL